MTLEFALGVLIGAGSVGAILHLIQGWLLRREFVQLRSINASLLAILTERVAESMGQGGSRQVEKLAHLSTLVQ